MNKNNTISDTANTVIVAGAGTMGHGIAYTCALYGYNTILFDPFAHALDKAKQSILTIANKAEAKNKLPENKDLILGRLSYGSDLKALIGKKQGLLPGLIIEAIPEDIELKINFFKECESLVSSKTILASNTSSLSLNAIAKHLQHKERFVGLHFFNPPYILKLLEIIKSEHTSQQTIAYAQQFAQQLQRTEIIINDSPGFASSRLGLVLGLEAIRMLEEGVGSAKDIDTAMTAGYKHPMGPLQLTDLVGLDVRLNIANYLYKTLKTEQFNPPQLLKDMVNQGKLGKKSGSGFYDY